MNEISAPAHQLPAGTVLSDRYEITRTLGEGGFGITYMGRNMVLDIPVAIKEYYPHGYANRSASYDLTVTITDSTQNSYFSKWKEKFLNEARALAKFTKIPNIVNVLDFFEQNGTAYIVMEYLNGITLSDYVTKKGIIEPESLCRIMIPMLKSLNKIHQEQLIHRDISPDNIMVMPDGTLKLYDFGAARDYSETTQKSLSVMLKPGFAPEEQYRSRGQQGPWTDVYAVCATMYYCITGIKPDDSVQRAFSDELKRPSELGIRISPQIEEAILVGMSIKAEDRFKNAEALANALERSLSISGHSTSFKSGFKPLQQQQQPNNKGIETQDNITEIVRTEYQSPSRIENNSVGSNTPTSTEKSQFVTKFNRKIAIISAAGFAVLGVIVTIIVLSVTKNTTPIVSDNSQGNLANIPSSTYSESTSSSTNNNHNGSSTSFSVNEGNTSSSTISTVDDIVDNSSDLTGKNQILDSNNIYISNSSLSSTLASTDSSLIETPDRLLYKNDVVIKGSVPDDAYNAFRYAFKVQSGLSTFYSDYEKLCNLQSNYSEKVSDIDDVKRMYGSLLPEINCCLSDLEAIKNNPCPNSLCYSFHEALLSLVNKWEEYIQIIKQYSEVNNAITGTLLNSSRDEIASQISGVENNFMTEFEALSDVLFQETGNYWKIYGENWGKYLVVFLEFIDYFDSISDISWETMPNDLATIKSYSSRLAVLEKNMSGYTAESTDLIGYYSALNDFVIKARTYVNTCELLFSSTTESEIVSLAEKTDVCRDEVSKAYDKAATILQSATPAS